MYPVGCDRHEDKNIGGHLKFKEIVGFKSRFHHCPVSILMTDCTFNKLSNLSGLNHDPKDKRQVDEIEDTEDVLSQPYVCPLTAKRKCMMDKASSLLLSIYWPPSDIVKDGVDPDKASGVDKRSSVPSQFAETNFICTFIIPRRCPRLTG